MKLFLLIAYFGIQSFLFALLASYHLD